MADHSEKLPYPSYELLSIASEILMHYRLDAFGIHGISHWGRVPENGAVLAAWTGANLRVVQLSALCEHV